jgi:hypothetical protein
MNRPRMTIARLMCAIMIIALNAGLIRAFFVQEMFYGVILMFFAMQVGLFRLLRSRGRARRFWVGFELAGIAMVLALFWAEFFPDSALNKGVSAYIEFAMNMVIGTPHLPTALDDFLMDHQVLLLVVVCFPPELVVALLGGLLTMRVDAGLLRRGLGPNPCSPRCPQPSDVLTLNCYDHD